MRRRLTILTGVVLTLVVACAAPSAIMGMEDRAPTGTEMEEMKVLVRQGMENGAFADVVVFDLDSLRDKATYQRPHQLAEGMVYVIVNGRLAVDDGRFTGESAGRVLSGR